MRAFLFVPILQFACLTTMAQSTQPITIQPVVSIATFRVGQEWTWDYSSASGEPYSSERYRVVQIQGAKVTFEMASTYGQPADHPISETPHHRLTANLDRCLKAHRNAADPQPWSVELDFWDARAGIWISAGPTRPLAFEEKFNCNPNPQATLWQHASQLDQKHGRPVFRTLRKNGTDGTWFELQGSNAGVAVEKEFHQRGQLTYRFVRRP